MGLIQMGVPKDKLEFLKEELEASVFIEGGTYYGKTAEYASRIFKGVYTVEKSEIIYDQAVKNLSGFRNVTVLKGDTRKYLGKLIAKNDNIIFWLDSHWSGGDTYGKNDECPLLEELEIIFGFERNCAILIDDARLFLHPPPSPHKITSWPTIKEIVETIPGGYEILIFDDVIYIFPSKIASKFRTFIQSISTLRWEERGRKAKFARIPKTLINKFINIFK